MLRSVLRRRVKSWGPVAALAAVAVLVQAIPLQPALAAPLMFPTDQVLVPVAVAGAFVFPALLAAVFAGFGRLWRSSRALFGLAGLAIAGLAVAGYLNPGLLAMLRI
jgi:hypothetical protein